MTKSVFISQLAHHGHLCSKVTCFYLLLYWTKMGFDKSLENYVRARRAWKG